MDSYTQYLQAIKDEITNDPMNLGYKGKSDKEITDLLNNPYFILVPQEQTSRIAQIINQIPFTPNAANELHVTTAQQPLTPQSVEAVADDIASDKINP